MKVIRSSLNIGRNCKSNSFFVFQHFQQWSDIAGMILSTRGPKVNSRSLQRNAELISVTSFFHRLTGIPKPLLGQTWEVRSPVRYFIGHTVFNLLHGENSVAQHKQNMIPSRLYTENAASAAFSVLNCFSLKYSNVMPSLLSSSWSRCSYLTLSRFSSAFLPAFLSVSSLSILPEDIRM